MKRIFTLCMLIGSLASCQKSEQTTPDGTSSRVKIEPLITRATESDFEQGDRIGLRIVRASGVYAENTCLVYDEGLFSGDLLWYAEADQTSTLSAYYPYDDAGVPTTFNVATDQREGYGASDLMAAAKQDVLPTSASVSLVFRHMLSKIVVNTTNETSSAIASVTLGGSIPTANFDPEALAATVADGAAAEITTQQVTENSLYRAIVVPQQVAFTLGVTTQDGTLYTQPLAELTLLQGGQYTVNVRITEQGLRIAVDGQIEDWVDEGEIGAAPDEVPFEEYEGYFVYGGDTYRTVTLSDGSTWMIDPMRYVPEGFTPSTDPLVEAHIWHPYRLVIETSTTVNADSAEALVDDESIARLGYLYDMYAALGGVEVTTGNCYDFEGARGICPQGWHLPTRTELLSLCGLSNKAEGETANLEDPSALFYDSSYGGGRLSLFDQGGWNYVLSGVRMKTNFTATPRYQLTRVWSGNSTLTDRYGEPALTYILSSTCYKPIYSSETLSNIQFFSQMTTFTSVYPEGRINLAYSSIQTGQQLRCVKDR